MASRLTAFSKFLITLIILAALFFAGRYLLNNTGIGQQLKKQGAEASSDASGTNSRGSATSGSSSLSKQAVKVGVVTWGGYAGGEYFNEGFKANTDSRYYKEYGFPVEFKNIG
jgi:NitT/TauT family transport system substrate-binding protein